MKFLFALLFITSSISFSQELDLKVFLQGSFKTNKMETSLGKNRLIPLSQPYNISPWNYNGEEKVSNLPPNIVDWILVELVPTENNTRSITKAAFLRNDGIIVDLDGKSNIQLDKQNNSAFYIIIKHRNHLSVKSPIPVSFSENRLSFDFTKSDSEKPTNLVSLTPEIFGMAAGDTDGNGTIDNSDIEFIQKNIFKTEYSPADTDMNGIVNVLDYALVNKNGTLSVNKSN